MSEIPVAAQQLIVDSIKTLSPCFPRVFLCHDASSLSSVFFSVLLGKFRTVRPSVSEAKVKEILRPFIT